MPSVQLLSRVRLFVTPWTAACLGLPVHRQLPKFIQTHVHWVGDAIQLYHPVLSSSPPTFNLSHHRRLFQGVSSLHQVARILKFQLQHQSFHSGLTSFRMDLFDLLAAQGILKSLLQHHSSKASVLWCSAFFILQLSYTGKTIALTRWTFVGKRMSIFQYGV